MMLRRAFIAASLGLIIGMGCNTQVTPTFYEVTVGLVDASTGQRIEFADVEVDLRRDGESIFPWLPVEARLNFRDRFEALVTADSHGALAGVDPRFCSPKCVVLDLGEPPDEARITVRAHQIIGTAILPIVGDDFPTSDYGEEGLVIALPTVEVQLMIDCDMDGIADSDAAVVGGLPDCGSSGLMGMGR